MSCSRYRKALSARVDGEDPGLDPEELEEHLVRCAGCRMWEATAAEVTRHARLQDAPVVPDLTDQIVAAVRAEAPRPRRVELAQAGLAAVAVAQLVLSVPALAGLAHASHESAVWEIALAVGLLAAAARPERAATLLPVAAVAVVALVPVVWRDIAAGGTDPVAESGHLLLVAAVVLLVALRRWAGSPGGGTAAPVSRPDGGEGRAA
ncbi:MAG: zf-HC2 domain-containing protein [Actinomycetes bacterium]